MVGPTRAFALAAAAAAGAGAGDGDGVGDGADGCAVTGAVLGDVSPLRYSSKLSNVRRSASSSIQL